MAKKLYEEEKIRAIAERIKKFSGDDTPMTTAQMPDGVSLVRMASFASGFDEGKVHVKTNEARTADDIIGTPSTQTELEISVKAGYYAADTNKYFDVSFSYNEGYDEGKSDGYGDGYDDGYDAGYEAGAASGGGGDYDEVWQDGYDEGYAEGFADGESDTEHRLITLIEQAQAEQVVRMSSTQYFFPTNTFGNYGGPTFDDMTDIQNSSISSNPLTISIDNYSGYYAHYCIRATNMINDDDLSKELILPPNVNSSVLFTSSGGEYDWNWYIQGVRYMKYEP